MMSPAATVAGSVGEAIGELVATLQGYADTLKSDSKDGRRAQKVIQCENYQQQKQP
jgi:hypothetical protein